MIRTLATVLVTLALLGLFAFQTWSQPATGFGPVYDAANQALRVNTVAGSASGGTSSNFGTAFPSAGTAAGFQDANGAMASISATNRLPVTCDNCSSSAATFGTAFPSSGSAIGGRDANGAFGSVTVSNSRALWVILASPATTNAGTETQNVRTTSDSTITATVTQSGIFNVRTTSDSAVTATVSQGNAGTPWNTRLTSDSTSTATVTQANASNLNATVAQGAAGTPWNARLTSDSTVTATVTQTTAANLNMRPDHSSATGTLASARVSLIGGLGASATGVNFLACDEFASISTANTGNWRLVAAETGKRIWVCGYTVVASGPLAIKFVRGGGAGGQFQAGGCNAGSADLTGAMNVAASGGIVNAVGLRPVFSTTNGAEHLCIDLSDNKQVSGHLSFTQF